MNAATWDHWINQHQGSFLQSWAWGNFQEEYGRRVYRLSSDSLRAQCISHRLPAGWTYLFVPYGPIGQWSNVTAAALFDQVTTVADKERAIFLRYERGYQYWGGRLVRAVHPQHTQIIPLRESAQMLAAMKQKWRYNIHLAERKGVRVHCSTAVADMHKLYPLLQHTAQRQGIAIHPLSYYQTMVHSLGAAGMLQLYLAEYQGQIIAGQIMIGFGSTMTYVHGGSNHRWRAVMAPHLLHWRAMVDAYTVGYQWYDLFGIAPPQQPQHSWAGLTRFKQGFGGEQRSYDSSTADIPLRPVWYNAYRLANVIWIS